MIDREILKVFVWIFVGFIGGYSFAWGGSDHVEYRYKKRQLEKTEEN